jgi:hypothetical protein
MLLVVELSLDGINVNMEAEDTVEIRQRLVNPRQTEKV